MEVFGVVALGLVMTACASGGDQHATNRDRGNIGGDARGEVSLGPIEGSETVRQAQSELKRESLYEGRVDGIAGPATTQGITEFQRREGLQQTARLDRATRGRMALRALRMDHWSSEAAQRSTATQRSGSSMPPN